MSGQGKKDVLQKVKNAERNEIKVGQLEHSDHIKRHGFLLKDYGGKVGGNL